MESCCLCLETDLSPLGCMPYLVSLDVSHNELTTVLDFKPPLGLRVRYKPFLCIELNILFTFFYFFEICFTIFFSFTSLDEV